jgi:hypothetical protein
MRGEAKSRNDANAIYRESYEVGHTGKLTGEAAP